MMHSLSILLVSIAVLFWSCQPQSKDSRVAPDHDISIRRFGQIIKVKTDKLDYYKELHANPWPCVLQKIKACNIQNYSIYHQGEYLFAYFEYTGNNFDADMELMAKDSCTVAWWKKTDPCQEPISSAKQGEWWTNMEELFHSN